MKVLKFTIGHQVLNTEFRLLNVTKILKCCYLINKLNFVRKGHFTIFIDLISLPKDLLFFHLKPLERRYVPPTSFPYPYRF